MSKRATPPFSTCPTFCAKRSTKPSAKNAVLPDEGLLSRWERLPKRGLGKSTVGRRPTKETPTSKSSCPLLCLTRKRVRNVVHFWRRALSSAVSAAPRCLHRGHQTPGLLPKHPLPKHPLPKHPLRNLLPLRPGRRASSATSVVGKTRRRPTTAAVADTSCRPRPGRCRRGAAPAQNRPPARLVKGPGQRIATRKGTARETQTSLFPRRRTTG